MERLSIEESGKQEILFIKRKIYFYFIKILKLFDIKCVTLGSICYSVATVLSIFVLSLLFFTLSIENDHGQRNGQCNFNLYLSDKKNTICKSEGCAVCKPN